ncbi:hypothetical protein EDD36DRAFT_331028 [Exophiala viscosa]|uniref:SET domain-containing protein n=1 Tax=Exophiala viscosa TaxID=2486360 RepID=A0AAN6IAG5_9EURO|nr:hypothetical protein EDD36DRAFT_331028 [Exophiala viscosa]
MNSLSSSSSEDTILADLLAYCDAHKIEISPNVSIRRVPGKGLGVYTTQSLNPGDRLMHVPTAALLTTTAVPHSFASKEIRKDIPVHALLAAYLTFGLSEAKKDGYARWMATWPRLTDFTWTVPIFWPERLRTPLKVQHHEFCVIPPSLTGSWTSSDLQKNTTKHKVLDEQLAKFETHVHAVGRVFPDHAGALLSPSDPPHWSFIHNWNAVNSRCFYYVCAGQRPPKDSNEAMALCPGMDLFNHTDDAGCKTTYDKRGYYVTAEQAYEAGQEVLLNYGAHGNDMLWTEYGFTMDRNKFDGLRLDEIVLSTLTDAQRKVLEEAEYLGEYWLRPDGDEAGVCWRTEVVSYLGVLSQNQWYRFIEGKLEPGKFPGSLQDGKRKRDDATATVQESPLIRAKRKQVVWIEKIEKEAQKSLEGLLSLASPDQMVRYFVDEDSALEAQGAKRQDLQQTKSGQARLRHRMCVQRWRQISRLAKNALEKLKRDLPADANPRTAAKSAGLEQRVDEFMDRG